MARSAMLSLLLSTSAALPGRAQVLVSNIGQTPGSASTGLNSWETAQGFTTGSHSDGYTLESIEVRLGTGAAGLTVKLATGLPSATTVVATLTNPATFTGGNNTFTAPANTTLSANTTYWVVVEGTAGTVPISSTVNEDPGGAAGWSVSNSKHFRSKTSAGAWSSSNNPYLIRVNGSAVPPTVTISGGSAVTEGTAASFTVMASTAPSANLTVNLAVSEAAGSDFVAAADEGAKTVTISSGATSAAYSVATQGDSVDEPNGSVTVQVGAGTGYTAGTPSSASVTVNDDDSAPTVANAIPDQVAAVGSAFSFAFPANTFSDADGDALTYTAVQSDDSALPSWLTFAASTRTFSGTPAATNVGTVSVKVTASDGANSVSDTFDVTVSTRPTISSVSIVSKPRTANSGGQKVIYGRGQAIAVDVTWNEAVAWDLSATSAGIGVRLQIGSTNRRAELVTGGQTRGSSTTLRFTYTVVTADADADGVAVVQASQNRLVLLRSGATLKNAAGTVDATVTHGGLSAQSGHLVNGSNAAPGNSAPTFSGTVSETLNAPAGTLVNYAAAQSAFSDTDNDPLSFTLSADRGAEAYSTLTHLGGRIFFGHWPGCVLATRTPALPKLLDTVVTYAATDPDGASATMTRTMRSTNWVCPGVSSAAVDGATLTLKMDARIPTSGASMVPVPGAGEFEVKVDGAAAALAAANPVAVALSDSTVTLTLAAPVAPGQAVTVSYTPDAHSLAAEGNSQAPVTTAFTDRAVTNNTNTAPRVANPIPDRVGKAGRAFSYQFPENTFADADGDALTYAAVQSDDSALPSWLTFASGTRTFSGTVPGTSSDGDTISIKVTASDGAASVSDAFDIVATTGPFLAASSPVAVDDATGKTVTLTFDESLKTMTAAQLKGLEFAFSIAGAWSQGVRIPRMGPDRVAVSGATVTLNLPSGAEALRGRGISVSYDAGIAEQAGDARLRGTDNVIVRNFRSDTVTRAAGGAIAPVLTDAEAAGTTLTLTFDRALDAGSAPAGRRFRVVTEIPYQGTRQFGGTGTAAISGSTVTVTLESAVEQHERIAVWYVKGDDANPLRGASSGPEVADILGFLRGTVSDKTVPKRVSAGVAGTKLALYYDEPLDDESQPPASAFAVTAGGAAQTVSGVSVDASAVTLTLGATIAFGTAVTLNYTKPTTGANNKIRDAAGNEADSFTGQAVTSHGPANAIAPAVVSASAHLGVLTLTWDKPLDPAHVPAPGAFTQSQPSWYEENSTRHHYVTSVTVREKEVRLGLNIWAFSCSEDFTLSYAVPTGTEAATALRTLWGVNAPALTDQAVTVDRSTVHCTGTFVRGGAEAGGANGANSLQMTFDRPLQRSAPPSAVGFSVRSGGGNGASAGDVPVTEVGFPEDPAGLVLTLGRELVGGELLTVSYLPRTAHRLWTAEGEQVAPFTIEVAVAVAEAANDTSNVSAEDEALPDKVSLAQNYPNPFNPSTAIDYELPQTGNVRLAVYDMLGREVAVLFDDKQSAGRHTVRFDAGGLPSGAYVYLLETDGRILTRRLMLVK